MQEKQSKKKKRLNSYIKYSSLATQMAVIIIAGAYFGKYLDSKNSTETLYTIIFSLASKLNKSPTRPAAKNSIIIAIAEHHNF